jgi:hypothetical protein
MRRLAPPKQPAVQLPRMLGARQYLVITQTITRQSTTITTYVTLGGPSTANPDAGGAGGGGSDSQPPPPPPAIYGSSGSLSSAQIFAILGSVIAFVAIVLIIWHCLTIQKRRTLRIDSDYDSSYMGSSSVVSDRPRRGPPRPAPWPNRRGPQPRRDQYPRAPQPTYRPAPMPNVRPVPNVNYAHWPRATR